MKIKIIVLSILVAPMVIGITYKYMSSLGKPIAKSITTYNDDVLNQANKDKGIGSIADNAKNKKRTYISFDVKDITLDNKPKETKTNTGKPKETKTNTDKPKETKTNTGKPKETKTNTGKPKETKTNTGKPKETKTKKTPKKYLPANTASKNNENTDKTVNSNNGVDITTYLLLGSPDIETSPISSNDNPSTRKNTKSYSRKFYTARLGTNINMRINKTSIIYAYVVDGDETLKTETKIYGEASFNTENDRVSIIFYELEDNISGQVEAFHAKAYDNNKIPDLACEIDEKELEKLKTSGMMQGITGAFNDIADMLGGTSEQGYDYAKDLSYPIVKIPANTPLMVRIN